jgi:hypothetical protein
MTTPIPVPIYSIPGFSSYNNWINNLPIYSYDVETLIPDIFRYNMYWKLFENVFPVQLTNTEFPSINNEPIVYYSRPVLLPDFNAIRCMLFYNIQDGLLPNRLSLRNMVTEDQIMLLNNNGYFTITRPDAANIAKYINQTPNGLFSECINIILHVQKTYNFFIAGKRDCSMQIPWYATVSGSTIGETIMPNYLNQLSFQSLIVVYRTLIQPYQSIRNPLSVTQFNEQTNAFVTNYLERNQLVILIDNVYQVIYDLLMFLKSPETNTKYYMTPAYYQYVQQNFIKYYNQNRSIF